MAEKMSYAVKIAIWLLLLHFLGTVCVAVSIICFFRDDYRAILECWINFIVMLFGVYFGIQIKVDLDHDD